jgi:hypothetical protein
MSDKISACSLIRTAKAEVPASLISRLYFDRRTAVVLHALQTENIKPDLRLT